MSTSCGFGEVVELFRYPVKSLGGERLARVLLDQRGVVGDRLWSVRDADGKLGSGKSTRRFRKMPALLELSAAYDGDVPVIAWPDGHTARGDEAMVHHELSDQVGRPVTLAREEAISHFDEGPVHLVTTSSLAAAAGAGEPPVDARRTRANVVVSTEVWELLSSGEPGSGSGQGFIEDGWVGRHLRVGPAELVVVAPMPRCVMLGMAQPGLGPAPELLRAVTARNSGALGVVAEVLRGGSVAVGDEVRLG